MAPTGRLTRKLIPDVREWLASKHGDLPNSRTHGHGCFQDFLYRIGNTVSPEYLYCREADDTAEHTFLICPVRYGGKYVRGHNHPRGCGCAFGCQSCFVTCSIIISCFTLLYLVYTILWYVFSSSLHWLIQPVPGNLQLCLPGGRRNPGEAKRGRFSG